MPNALDLIFDNILTNKKSSPAGFVLEIRDVVAFWYKTETKIIYFVPLCLIVFEFMVHSDPKSFLSKIKKQPNSFLMLEADFFASMYVLTQGICNKFIEMKLS